MFVPVCSDSIQSPKPLVLIYHPLFFFYFRAFWDNFSPGGFDITNGFEDVCSEHLSGMLFL